MKKAFMIALIILLMVSGCRAGSKAADPVCSESVLQELPSKGDCSENISSIEQSDTLHQSSEETVSASLAQSQVLQKTDGTAKEVSVVEKTDSEQINSANTEASARAELSPEPVKATPADTEAIAERMVFYLNEYRKEQGVPPAEILDEYITYAEYRSRQLVSHFAHDTVDEREAATAVQVGTYVNPSDYGMDGEPYYTAGAREAITYSGFVGTVEEVAEHLAKLIRNSPDHWAYVGGGEYSHIAVGVTCHGGLWYADVAMKD